MKFKFSENFRILRILEFSCLFKKVCYGLKCGCKKTKSIEPLGVFTFSTLAIIVATSVESISRSEFFFVRRRKMVLLFAFFLSRFGELTVLVIAFCMFSLRDFLLTSDLFPFLSEIHE